MTDLGSFYDPGFVPEDDRDFAPLPEGEYTFVVNDMEPPKDNAKKTGKYVKVDLRVDDGKFANRRLFNYFNIIHENPTVQSIGQSQLFKFSQAVGMARPGKIEDYIGKRGKVFVMVSDDGKNNDCKRFMAIDGKKAPPPPPPPKVAPAAPLVDEATEAGEIGGGQSLPWEN